MASNPYELRWELLQQAETRLMNRYQAEETRYSVLVEKGEDPGEYPKYPTDYQIHSLAMQMNAFISGNNLEVDDNG